MQIPIILAGPLTLTIPVTPGETGGLGGTIIHATHGPPATLEASWDGESWHPARLPWQCGGSGQLRLTRTDESAVATVLAATGGEATPYSSYGSGAVRDIGGPGQHLLTAPAALTLDVAAEDYPLFALVLPTGAPYLRARLVGGTGEAELYLYWTDGVQRTQIASAPGAAGITRDGVQAGRYVLEVYAETALTGVTLEVLTENPETGSEPFPLPLENGVATPPTNIAARGGRYYRVTLPEGAASLTMTASGGEVYLRRGAPATFGTGEGGDPSVTLPNPEPGEWWVWWATLPGTAITDGTLTATWS